MREVEVFIWRTLWCGKWGNTRYKCTEEDIRKENPEAIKIESSREVRLVPETEEEQNRAMYAGSTGLGGVARFHSDGRQMMAWEQSAVDHKARQK